MDTQTVIRLFVGLLMTAVVGVFALRRISWLFTLVRSGRARPRRTDDLGTRIRPESRRSSAARLLRWSVPGLAHFFTMWGFVVLLTVYVEAYGCLFGPNFAIPSSATGPRSASCRTSSRSRSLPRHHDLRDHSAAYRAQGARTTSRFYGCSHGGAWLILFMIFNVIWTYALVPRGVGRRRATCPTTAAAFFSHGMGKRCWNGWARTGNEFLETVSLLLHIGVMLAFLIIVLHSKHLHIFLAPINVTFKRLPDGTGPLLPMEYNGKPIDFEDPDEDAVFGRGKIEDFTWKGMLDFATCTECGRCQSQCPAWNTGKPLSPKLRDHGPARPLDGEGAVPPRQGSRTAGRSRPGDRA